MNGVDSFNPAAVLEVFVPVMAVPKPFTLDERTAVLVKAPPARSLLLLALKPKVTLVRSKNLPGAAEMVTVW